MIHYSLTWTRQNIIVIYGGIRFEKGENNIRNDKNARRWLGIYRFDSTSFRAVITQVNVTVTSQKM